MPRRYFHFYLRKFLIAICFSDDFIYLFCDYQSQGYKDIPHKSSLSDVKSSRRPINFSESDREESEYETEGEEDERSPHKRIEDEEPEYEESEEEEEEEHYEEVDANTNRVLEEEEEAEVFFSFFYNRFSWLYIRCHI